MEAAMIEMLSREDYTQEKHAPGKTHLLVVDMDRWEAASDTWSRLFITLALAAEVSVCYSQEWVWFPLVAVGYSYTLLLMLCSFCAKKSNQACIQVSFPELEVWISEFLTCHEHSIRLLFVTCIYSFKYIYFLFDAKLSLQHFAMRGWFSGAAKTFGLVPSRCSLIHLESWTEYQYEDDSWSSQKLQQMI